MGHGGDTCSIDGMRALPEAIRSRGSISWAASAWRHTLWCFVALLFGAGPAAAQAPAITGVVRDPQQAVVAGAEVVLIDARTGVKTTTLTDGLGRFSLAAAPGDYTLEVHARGFEVATQMLALAAGETATRDVALKVAGTSESVTVTGLRGTEEG
jgi:VCBS repeat-containing protein